MPFDAGLLSIFAGVLVLGNYYLFFLFLFGPLAFEDCGVGLALEYHCSPGVEGTSFVLRHLVHFVVFLDCYTDALNDDSIRFR